MTRALDDIALGLDDYEYAREWADPEGELFAMLGYDDKCSVCDAFTCMECFRCREQHGNESACSCNLPWPGEPGYVEVAP